MDAPNHGHYNTYKRGCRCDDCRAANTAYCAKMKAKRGPAPIEAHGTRNGYNNYGCRCEWCRLAWVVVIRDSYDTPAKLDEVKARARAALGLGANT